MVPVLTDQYDGTSPGAKDTFTIPRVGWKVSFPGLLGQTDNGMRLSSGLT